MTITSDRIHNQVRQYYEDKLASHGATPRGVDWNSQDAQEKRFEQVLKICETKEGFTINDYGCGYGALAAYMARNHYSCDYCGFDVSEEMIREAEARDALGGVKCGFTSDVEELLPATYAVASGVFSVKLRFSNRQWKRYVLDTLDHLDQLSVRGFAFNMLTRYSDRHFMRPDLYYGDPSFFFKYCKERFSPHVALLHDYPLYEFTIAVRKDM